MIYTPHSYQQHAEDHIITHPAAGLFLDMGLGKTVTTLTAINRLTYGLMEVERVLVIAPKRVAEDTWSTEIAKWDHLKHLTISKVLGTEAQRKKALMAKADIYVINRENVPWLVSYYAGAWPFDMIVIDELSSFKDGKSARFKALRQVRPKAKRVVGLTGTPAPNSLIDLWSQLYLLDEGHRLGKTITSYRNTYFTPGRRNGHVVYDYNRKDGDDLLGTEIYQQEIYDKIGDICISMKAEDYLTLPGRIDRTHTIHLPQPIMKQYLDFERQQILALEGEEISAVNAAALTGKLLQFANGAVYDDDKNWHQVHTAMLEALTDDIEAANGNPVLVFYWFKHDLERIRQHLKAYKPVELKGSADITKWNAGQIPVMLVHPASAGHGLNLQTGGNYMTWFGLPWSLELYLQAVARLDRQGQQRRVINSRLIVQGTMHEDVLKALDAKKQGQDALMEAVKARIAKYMKQVA